MEAAHRYHEYRKGRDHFSAITGIISGGSDGLIFECRASNGVSADRTDSVELRGELSFCS